MTEASERKGFMLFSCCLPVKGAVRSIVCDLQRSDHVFISNELFEMLDNGRFISPQIIDEIATRSNGTALLEQLKVLEEREFIFQCAEDESRLFSQMELKWESPKTVTNAMIDSDKDSNHSFPDVFYALVKLGCQAVQMRFFDSVDGPRMETILDSAQTHCFTDVEIIVPDMGISTALIGRSWSKRFPVLTKVIFHSAETNRLLADEREQIPIYQITNKITSSDHCGFIHPDGFVTGKEMFSEAQSFNSCLNRKLSIDARGDIRICPSMKQSFGNIRQVSLSSVARLEEVRVIWGIKKDQISICRDCEFRYICTDCRAHLSDESDLFSKPLKCSYDPYTATWKD